MPVQPRAVRRRKPLGSKPRTNLPPRSAFGPRRFAYAGRSSPGVLVPGVPTTRCVLRERQIDLPRQCPRQGNAAWPLDHQATEPTRNLPHLKYPRSTEPSDVLAAAGSCLPTREGTYERVAQPTPVIARLPASMGECPRWPARRELGESCAVFVESRAYLFGAVSAPRSRASVRRLLGMDEQALEARRIMAKIVSSKRVRPRAAPSGDLGPVHLCGR